MNTPASTNIWCNSLVNVLSFNDNKVLFTCHGDPRVYDCPRAVWELNPLPRSLKLPE